MMYIQTQEVYNRQNKSLHRAFSATGLPYEENRETWLSLFRQVAMRPVEGLSDMTLAERRALIDHLNQKHQWKGKTKLFNPLVYRSQEKWRKGDPEPKRKMNATRPLSVPSPKMRYVKKIGALLTVHKRPWSYVDAIAKSRFGVEMVEYCDIDDLKKVMQMLIIDSKRRENEIRK